MTIKNLTIFLLSAYLSNNILCWHSTGHLTVARIAELYLP
jgi:S1/P1 Nuclease